MSNPNCPECAELASMPEDVRGPCTTCARPRIETEHPSVCTGREMRPGHRDGCPRFVHANPWYVDGLMKAAAAVLDDHHQRMKTDIENEAAPKRLLLMGKLTAALNAGSRAVTDLPTGEPRHLAEIEAELTGNIEKMDRITAAATGEPRECGYDGICEKPEGHDGDHLPRNISGTLVTTAEVRADRPPTPEGDALSRDDLETLVGLYRPKIEGHVANAILRTDADLRAELDEWDFAAAQLLDEINDAGESHLDSINGAPTVIHAWRGRAEAAEARVWVLDRGHKDECNWANADDCECGAQYARKILNEIGTPAEDEDDG